jgi:ATP-dependent Clp protease ATP-binding subunit ClpC
MLLGLIEEGDGVAAKALAELGVSLEATRLKIGGLTEQPIPSPARSSPAFTERAKEVMEMSLEAAFQLGNDNIDTEHLLLALVREGHGVGALALASLGVELAAVRKKVMFILWGNSEEDPPAQETRGS